MVSFIRSPRQVGALIQRERKRRGLTQIQLGQLAGLRQATVSRLEAGEPAIQLQTIVDVMAALDLEFTIGSREDFTSENIAAQF